MLKKFLSVFIITSLIMSSAMASGNQGLKSAFDELSYALNVEWDQQDKAFYQTQMQKFIESVSELQTQGLTQSEMSEFIKTELQDQKLAKDVETVLNMISLQKMSPTEASQYMLSVMKNSSSRGASWSYDAKLILVSAAVVIGFALVVALSITFAPESSGEGSFVTGGCSQSYQCNQFCYNDAVWGYTCQPNCFWTCY